MTIEEFLGASDPTVEECFQACLNYVKDHPIFSGENYINMIGLDVTGLLFTTYTEEEKTRKIKEISQKDKGNRRMLIGNYLYSLYAISKNEKEFKKMENYFKNNYEQDRTNTKKS